MSPNKERGPSNRFYGPLLAAKSKPGPLAFRQSPSQATKTKSASAETETAGAEHKSSAGTVLCLTKPPDAASIPSPPRSYDSLFDPTPPQSAMNSSIKTTVVSVPGKRDASVLSSHAHELKISKTSTFESTIPRKIDFNYFGGLIDPPSAEEETADSPDAESDLFLKSVSSKLHKDAARFDLSVTELVRLKSEACSARETAYCMLSLPGRK